MRPSRVHVSLRLPIALVAELDDIVAQRRAADYRMTRTEVVEEILTNKLRESQSGPEPGEKKQGRALRGAGY